MTPKPEDEIGLFFVIDRDDLPPERLAEYARLLNEMLGIEGEWELVPKPAPLPQEPEE